MASILTSLSKTVIAGFVFAVLLFILYMIGQGYSGADFGSFFFR
jgi:hypothetical protein